jgi:hypothetical protein
VNTRAVLAVTFSVAILGYVQPGHAQTPRDNPSSCKCAPGNWPPAGDNSPPADRWKPNSGKGNPGQDVHTQYAEVWTHACAAGGTALDEIMFKLFAEAPAANVIRNVSIYDSPAMPDLGGHSILGGLLTGKGLGAINPNLAVCVMSPGTGGRVCTTVCKPGHQCLAQPFERDVKRNPSSPAFTIGVFDVDRPGSVHKIVEVNQDPALCTASHHCKIRVQDTATYGPDAVVEIAFNAGSTETSACDPTQAHIIQFVRSEICNGGICGPNTSIPSGELTSYPQGGCGGDRKWGQWYLDNGDCSEPFLVPEVYCGAGGNCSKSIQEVTNPLRFVVDEPTVVYQTERWGSFQLERHFVDFVMCGAQVKDVVQWTRTGIGAPPCGNRTLSSDYQVQKAFTIRNLQGQLCNVVKQGGRFQGDGAQAFGGVQVYLDCPL